MLIRLRYINSKICRILNIVMAIAGQPHEICPTALALYHITEGFLIQSTLSQHTDHQRSILDQGNRSMLQLTCRIGLRMNIGNLL